MRELYTKKYFYVTDSNKNLKKKRMTDSNLTDSFI